MLDKVKTYCDLCQDNYDFYFGLPKDMQNYGWFLNEIVQKQKNLVDWEVFKNEYQKDREWFYTIEGYKSTFKDFHNMILDFFNDEEKKLLKTEILLSFDLSIYPAILKDDVNSEIYELMHVPLVEFNFLGNKQYSRSYPKLLFVQFNEEQSIFTCPKDLKMSAKRLYE
ncbi:hypothetical protein [Mycoplasmopsis columboralis]|uniref:Uncharacterized protein n=1 Tax=Mycoplasmopsis columboralis TaxID=171282 RepID=A0A449B6T1_9BACT|nr:hypothetical protein [Mycoplasmopsis columboralis]VEU76289.1 Uncharacterised protein [Mycoplasmopsis columboralis]